MESMFSSTKIVQKSYKGTRISRIFTNSVSRFVKIREIRVSLGQKKSKRCTFAPH